MNNSFDPYAGNLLVEGLGPILSRPKALIALTFIPPPPRDVATIPKHFRRHQIMALRDFYLATKVGADIQETIDIMVRQSYRYRDPLAAQTWGIVGGEQLAHKTPRAPAMAAAVVGHSGTGKTEAILRAFQCFPKQIITHAKFPKLAGAHHQVVWQSIDVPASGRLVDLAENLMIAWDCTMEKNIPDRPQRFAASIAKSRRDGMQMLNEWRQVALSHFLGILHLDEVQNFFKLETLEKRRKRTVIPQERELRIIEDQCLKVILSLTNTWQMPLVLSGTPDGVQALTKRLSNVERLVSSGYHLLEPFKKATEPAFSEVFFKKLIEYQYVSTPLPASDALAQLIIELTAGIPRLIIAFWIAAHRIAFERETDDLRIEDFKEASRTLLAPVAPAVAALRSGDPLQMARYEDLLPTDEFWETFWNQLTHS